MHTFEDLLLEHSFIDEVLDNETANQVLTDLYYKSDFVDMLLLFKQTGELNLSLFKQVVSELCKHIDAFNSPMSIVSIVIIELNDMNDTGANLMEYAKDIRGILASLQLSRL
jgi:hypothetical protein